MMSSYQFEGSTALITGASSGIGQCFARELAQKRSNLIITSRSKAELEILASELRLDFSLTVDVVTADLSIPSAHMFANRIQKSRQFNTQFITSIHRAVCIRSVMGGENPC